MTWLSRFNPLHRWRRIAQQRPMRFTRFGLFYVLFTLGVGAAAINTGNNLLYLILGMQLSFIIVSGFLSDSVLWGLRSHWRPQGDLFVGRRASWTVEAHKGRFPAALVRIQGEWESGGASHTWAPWVHRQRPAFLRLHMTPSRRGWLRLKRVRYGTAFPFGLFEKTYAESREDRWVVFPRIKPLDLQTVLGPAMQGMKHAETPRAGEGAVPWRLREYRAGDSLRRMDWKAVAKRRQWLVKETEEDVAPSPVLWVRAWPKDALDAFISFIASLLNAAVVAKRPLGLCTPDHFFAGGLDAASVRPIWRYLALVDPATAKTQGARTDARRFIDVYPLWQTHRHDDLA